LDVDTLRFEKEKLELRVKELTEQLGEASSRAAALHYRLWETLEDRRALEMNLAGERGASRMWEQTVAQLREENERLRRDGGGVRGLPEPGPANGR
jgi:chromosome segregation ATPase